MPQQRRQIFRLPIQGRRFRRSPISSPVVPHGVEFLAERWPHIVPYRGVRDPVVNQHHRARPAPALFVIQFSPLHFDEGPWPAVAASPELRRRLGTSSKEWPPWT